MNIPSNPNDVSSGLQRELVLRQFNTRFLNQEEFGENVYQQLVGMGKRMDAEGNMVVSPLANRSYHREVLDMFRYFPVAKYFGINVTQAMDLTIDRWNDIQASVILIQKEEVTKKSNNNNEEVLLQLLKDFIMSKALGGGAE